MNILDRNYIVTMPNGEKWAVPVMSIAMNRAQHFAYEVGGDIVRSLNEDTLPVFAEDHSEIRDWAQNNMCWAEVKDEAVKIDTPNIDPDYDDGWTNGEWELSDDET